MPELEIDGHSKELLEHILDVAWRLLNGDETPEQLQHPERFAGTLFQNTPPADKLTIQAGLARSGIAAFDGTSLMNPFMSSKEMLEQVSMIADASDLLVTSIHGKNRLGEGRDLAQAIASSIDIPVISYSDEIYSPLGAISEILGLKQALGSLDAKRVAISWCFGSRFHSPNIVHSLLIFLTMLGVDLAVAAPDAFHLHNQVRKKALKIAGVQGCDVNFVQEFEDAFTDVDAVFTMNWASLIEFQHPERNPHIAREFRDWYFTDSRIPKNAKVVFPPSIEHDLTASSSLIQDNREVNRTWLSRRIASLQVAIDATINESNPLI